MAKLLICDDEKILRDSLKRYAALDGHQVLEAANGQEALDLCQKENFDLLILDVMMPVMDGFTALKEIRTFSQVPVLMLTAKGDEFDRIIGFELGVDDYVVKPFSSREIMLRVQAILRRSQKASPHEVYQYKDLTVDLTSKKVLIQGQEISMAPMEYSLLFYFIAHKGIAKSRAQILEDLWGYKEEDDRTLDTHIKLLRKALGPYAQNIVTLRGYGYRFDEK
ncbi:Staphylococcal respiratory response protein A [Urinicoccus massiliensis]|uniref:Staphylococcal respiratory response protein A n=1 Tax=Urinicoccus massiliensis TaxID=1723382 RepID=A0A8H2QS88_9FIRM|nr:response regulator transcription factor [Urinicoccus massiliensis]VFB15610.1 Staphylococcal respiratory response protein A [Urinicoccus massiliensis]